MECILFLKAKAQKFGKNKIFLSVIFSRHTLLVCKIVRLFLAKRKTLGTVPRVFKYAHIYFMPSLA